MDINDTNHEHSESNPSIQDLAGMMNLDLDANDPVSAIHDSTESSEIDVNYFDDMADEEGEIIDVEATSDEDDDFFNQEFNPEKNRTRVGLQNSGFAKAAVVIGGSLAVIGGGALFFQGQIPKEKVAQVEQQKDPNDDKVASAQSAATKAQQSESETKAQLALSKQKDSLAQASEADKNNPGQTTANSDPTTANKTPNNNNKPTVATAPPVITVPRGANTRPPAVPTSPVSPVQPISIARNNNPNKPAGRLQPIAAQPNGGSAPVNNKPAVNKPSSTTPVGRIASSAGNGAQQAPALTQVDQAPNGQPRKGANNSSSSGKKKAGDSIQTQPPVAMRPVATPGVERTPVDNVASNSNSGSKSSRRSNSDTSNSQPANKQPDPRNNSEVAVAPTTPVKPIDPNAPKPLSERFKPTQQDAPPPAPPTPTEVAATAGTGKRLEGVITIPGLREAANRNEATAGNYGNQAPVQITATNIASGSTNIPGLPGIGNPPAPNVPTINLLPSGTPSLGQGIRLAQSLPQSSVSNANSVVPGSATSMSGARPAFANSQQIAFAPTSEKEATKAKEAPKAPSQSQGGGILDRNPSYDPRNNPAPAPAPSNQPAAGGAVSIMTGTSAKASTITPILWNGGANSDAKFIIRLDEGLKDTNGRDALPIGTQLVVVARSSGNGVALANIEVLSVIINGVEYAPPAGALVVRDERNGLLVGEDYFRREEQIANRDWMTVLTGAAGGVGQALIQPITSSSFSSGVGSTTTTTSRDPNILGAILDGGFKTLPATWSQRNQQAIAEITSKPQVYQIPQGRSVRVFVNQTMNF
jgi:Bacterial conjugation TrbI-like protein